MKLLKFALIGVVLLVLFLAGLGFLGWSQMNNLVRKGIEAGGTYAMGVNTTLHSVRVGLFSGSATLRGLRIANPPGYEGEHFLELGEASAAVTPASLRQPVIEMPYFTLDTIDVGLERRDGKANYQVILDNINKLQQKIASATGGGGGGDASSGGPETKLVINDLTIRKVTVRVDMLGASGAVGDVLNKATRVTIPIDEIKLQNVGKTGTGVGGTGVTMSQLASIVVQAVLGAAADKGGGLLPVDFLNDLKGNLGNLDALKGLGMNVTALTQGKVDEVMKDVGAKVEGAVKGAVDGAAKELDKGLKGVGEGLKGLIPGSKDKDKGGGG